MKVYVLRLGHRPARDKRISTHCALVARAFGADGILFDRYDENIVRKIDDVVKRFGGPFEVKMGIDWRKTIKDWVRKGGEVIHLTMYGLPLPEVIEEIKSSGKDKLVVIGSEKVPREVYEMSTYNVSVTNQPHSEVAALAVFLDWLFEGREFYKEFKGACIKIIPNSRGKRVLKL